MAVPEFLPNTLGGLVAVLGTGGGFGFALNAVLNYRKSYINRLQRRVKELEEGKDAADAICEAKLAVVRHDSNNTKQNLDAVLMILDMLPDEVLPERAKKAIAEIKRRRMEQEKALAEERGQVQAAIIAVATEGHVPAARAEKV